MRDPFPPSIQGHGKKVWLEYWLCWVMGGTLPLGSLELDCLLVWWCVVTYDLEWQLYKGLMEVN